MTRTSFSPVVAQPSGRQREEMSPNIKQQVKEFILDNFVMTGTIELPEDTSLMDSHIIDSTGFLELISFIEERFGIRVFDEEMVPENLDSLAGIERFVVQKQASATTESL